MGEAKRRKAEIDKLKASGSSKPNQQVLEKIYWDGIDNLPKVNLSNFRPDIGIKLGLNPNQIVNISVMDIVDSLTTQAKYAHGVVAMNDRQITTSCYLENDETEYCGTFQFSNKDWSDLIMNLRKGVLDFQISGTPGVIQTSNQGEKYRIVNVCKITFYNGCAAGGKFRIMSKYGTMDLNGLASLFTQATNNQY